MNVVEDLTSDFKAHTFALTILSAAPAGIDEPGLCFMLVHLVSKHSRVEGWMEGNECLSKACAEGWYWFDDANLGSRNLGSIPGHEVVHSLLWREPSNRWEHSICVTGQKDDVLWMAANGWNLHIWHKFQRVAQTSVLSN